MSSHHSLSSPGSDISELYDSVFPDSRGQASDRARMRELRNRALNEGVGVAAHLPLVTPRMLFPSRTSTKRRRTASPDHLPTMNERIDAVWLALKHNNLNLADFVRKTCAYDYGATRKREEPDFQLSSAEAEDAKNVRTWAKEIGCQELLREAKQMEIQHLLHTGGKPNFTCFGRV
jgi:hypothetical protein